MAAFEATTDFVLPVMATSTAAFEGIEQGSYGIAVKVLDTAEGPRIFVVVASPQAIVGAALDDVLAVRLATEIAGARLHLAAGDTGGRRH